jgi:hypothetical protein
MLDVRGIGTIEDDDAWLLCSGKIGCNVSGKVNAQQLPTI